MRKLGQALALLVMATCAAAAAAFVLLAVQYHRFSTEIHRSEAPLPATIRAALPPSRGTLDRPQVTLVRGSGGLASGGLVLFRTVPGAGTTAFLSVPPSAVIEGRRVSGQSIPRLVHVLRTALGIQVAHVAVIDLANVSRLVDGIGGIELRNPAAARASGLAVAHVALSGRDAAPERAAHGGLPAAGSARKRAARPGRAACASRHRRARARAHERRRPPVHRHRRRAFGRDRPDRCRCARPGLGPAPEPARRPVHAAREHGRRVGQRPGHRRRVPGARRLRTRRRLRRHRDRAHPVPAAEGRGRDRAALRRFGVRLRRRRGGPHGARDGRPFRADAGARSGPAASTGAGIAGAARAAMRRSEELTTRAARAGSHLAEWARTAVPRIRPPERDAGVLALPAEAMGLRARVRRFAYMHQDALWVGVAATIVATTVAAVLIAA